MNNELQTMEEQHVEVMQVSNAESLAALTRSEIDVQIATAKQYPRNLARVLGIQEIPALEVKQDPSLLNDLGIVR